MKIRSGTTACLALLILAAAPHSALSQGDIDFVFRDEDGHLILRFVGVPPAGLTPTQRDDVENSEFSTMVHDRLRADLRFEAQPQDPAWAAFMVPQIDAFLHDRLDDFASIATECRAASCRIVLEHTTRRTIPEHEVLLGRVQAVLQAFIAEHPGDFEREFMITAYEQESFLPHIKAFIGRKSSRGDSTERPRSD